MVCLSTIGRSLDGLGITIVLRKFGQGDVPTVFVDWSSGKNAANNPRQRYKLTHLSNLCKKNQFAKHESISQLRRCSSFLVSGEHARVPTCFIRFLEVHFKAYSGPEIRCTRSPLRTRAPSPLSFTRA